MSAPGERVWMVDCTLREGDQTAGVAMTPDEKLGVARSLDAAGVALADLGMPAVGEGERAFLRAAAAACTRMIPGASVRCRPDMAALALSCGVRAVFVICPISPQHLGRRLRTTPAELFAALRRCAALADAAGASLEVVAEDASRAERGALMGLLAAAEAVGAPRVYLADTVGCKTPAGFAALYRDAADAAGPGGPAIAVHCHDDLGMATANTVAAIEAGCRWPTATVNGLGERAGNADLGAVAVAAEVALGLDAGIDQRALPALSAQVAAASGVLVPASAPLVGRNAFRHESGIHVDGVLKDPATYEAVDPARLGRSRSLLVGKHSGRAHLRAVLGARGIALDDAQLDALRAQIQRAVTGRGRSELAAIRAALEAHAAACEGLREEAVAEMALKIAGGG